MKIRKLYRFEACHIVRDCNSERCKKSFHGHSYVVELFFKSFELTSYGMVIDFGDLKKNGIAKFIDKLDHSWHFWNKEDDSVKDFIKKNNQRWLELPFNPTAENYALWIMEEVNSLLIDIDGISCCGVRVHETATGYAEADMDCKQDLNQIDIINAAGKAIFSPETENS